MCFLPFANRRRDTTRLLLLLPRAYQGRDNIEYDAARERMKEVFRTNYQASAMYELPPFVGLVVSGVAAVVCVPLVFDLETASWFAEQACVDPDEGPGAAPSVATVGSWTWAWMEPMIGTASFSILCLQLFREQMITLAIKARPSRGSRTRARAAPT